jgi:hypothetical protein
MLYMTARKESPRVHIAISGVIIPGISRASNTLQHQQAPPTSIIRNSLKTCDCMICRAEYTVELETTRADAPCYDEEPLFPRSFCSSSRRNQAVRRGLQLHIPQPAGVRSPYGGAGYGDPVGAGRWPAAGVCREHAISAAGLPAVQGGLAGVRSLRQRVNFSRDATL